MHERENAGRGRLMSVSVLLATYNGAKYLRAQLDSILTQTFQDFVLRASDDCSNDGTRGILEQYAGRCPGRVVLSFGAKNSGGAKHNFLNMIFANDSDYAFLSDQDDVWQRNKLEATLAKMHSLERQCGKDTPLLVHTDLAVVDKDLNVIAPSYRAQVIHPDWDAFGLAQSLMMNIATGSTICYNRALRMALKQPDYAAMHDWWLLQTALLFGKVGHIYDRMVLYRQHGGNELGSSNVRSLKYKALRLVHNETVTQRFQDSYRQARALLAAYGNDMTEAQRDLVATYGSLPKMNKLKRVRTAFKIGALDTTFSRKAGAVMFM
jgi:glycosyltransferase involved in cell wall biosynthesis